MDEPINDSTAKHLLKYGIVEAEKVGNTLRLSASKLLLRVLCNHRRSAGTEAQHCTKGDKLPESAYLPPDEILRTLRDYGGDVQKLAHIWSFVVNFNALASLTLPVKGKWYRWSAIGEVYHSVTMAALREDTVLLEPHGSSLLTEELKVERDEDTFAPKLESVMRVISRLEKDEGKGNIQITNRVALHDVVNQDLFTAGLTTAGSEGIDAWARVGEDKLVLFQTKGQQEGPAVGQPGNSAVLTRKELHDCIASLLISAYASADDLVKHKIRAFLDDAESEEKQAELVSCECVCVCVFVCILSPSHSLLASWFSPASTCLPCIARLRASRHGSSGTRPRSWPSCWWCPSPAPRPRRNCPAASGTTSCMPSRRSGAKQKKHCWLSCARSRVTVTMSSAMQCRS